MNAILQDPVCAANDDEAVLTYRQALEAAIGNPSAAHPFELYGSENLSLAKASTQSLSKFPQFNLSV